MTTTPFDFSSIQGLNTFWDGTGDKAGGGTFNNYATGSKANINHNLDLLYQGLIGRNADSGGRDYWSKAIDSGDATYQSVADAIKASKESSGQINYLSTNPNASAADLKSLPDAYINPFHKYSGSAVAGWEPGDVITQEIADATSGKYSDQTRFTPSDIWNDIISGDLQLGGGQQYEKYDDSALLANISGLQGELSGLRSAFDKYKTDMDKMWANANWGTGANQQQSTVQGVKTQNELPGWTPKTGGSAGFFGRGGNRFGLTTGSLNI